MKWDLLALLVAVLGLLLKWVFKPLYSRIKENREWKAAEIAKIDGRKIETIESKNFIRIRGYQKDDNNQDTLECYLVEKFLNHILIRNNSSRYNRYLILGGSGVGKSTFSIALYYKYIKKYTKQNLPYSIFILNMGDENNYESSIAALKQKEKPEKSILILDALDENIHVGEDFEKFWEDLNRLMIDFKFVIITSRIQLFTDQTQVPKNVGFRHDNKWIPYKRFYICPFTDRDVHHYLRNTFNEGSEEWEQACTIVSKCECDDLMSKAMLLTYIKSLVGLNTESISIVDIYNEIIDYWLSRECEQFAAKDNPKHKETKNRLYDLSKRLAVYMQDRDSNYITKEDYKYFLEENKNLLSDEFNGKTYAFDRRSLVEWDNGKLKFSHRSFFEYFIALNIFENPGWSCKFPNSNLVETFLNEMCKAYFTYHVESPATSNKLNFGNAAIPINDTDDIWDEQWKAILFDAENASGNGDSSAIAIYDFWCLLVRKIVVRYNYIFVHLISQIKKAKKEERDFEPKQGLAYLQEILNPFVGFINIVQNTFVNDSLCDISKNVCAIRKKLEALLSIMISVSKNDTLLFEMLPKRNMPVFSNLFCLNEQYVENLLSRIVPVIGFGLYSDDEVLAFVDKLANNLNNRDAYLPTIFYIIKQSKNLNDAAQFIYQLNVQINQKERKLLPITIIIMVIFNGVELPYVCMKSLNNCMKLQCNNYTLEKIQLRLHNMYEIAKMKGDQI